MLKEAVRAAHSRLLAAHGGAEGVRDTALLESALARPHHRYVYGAPEMIDLSALYTASVVRNHPFVDGNKRTGFTIGIAFLELNGFEFQATEAEAIQAVFALAAGDLDEDGYAKWLRSNAKPRKR